MTPHKFFHLLSTAGMSMMTRPPCCYPDENMKSPVAVYADQLLAKRAELNSQVARGQLTLDEAEAALGRWHEEHRPA